MDSLNLVPFFVIGLLGAAHCAGMCGGIASALSMTGTKRRQFPVAVVTITEVSPSRLAAGNLLRLLAYNAGRIASYMTAGALAGGAASGMRVLPGLASWQIAGYWLVNFMLIALGLQLTGAWRGLARLEQAGSVAWRHVQPLVRPLLPMDTAAKALALGALWGWVPCAMVYSVLPAAMLTGSPWSGAAVMLAFGLGTLPALMGIGMAGMHWKRWIGKRGVRIAGGVLVLAFGVFGLIRAGTGISPGWLDIFCLTPSEQFH